MTLNYGFQGQHPTHVICKDGFELVAYGFLFAPHTMWALISDRWATNINMSFSVVSENG